MPSSAVMYSTHPTGRVSMATVTCRRRASICICGRCSSSWSAAAALVRCYVVFMVALVMSTNQSTVAAVPRPFYVGTRPFKIRLTAANGYQRRDLNDVGSSRLSNPLMMMRQYRQQCVASGGRCYKSVSCCRGLICADMNELTRLEPGYCVRVKELQSCKDNLDCSPDYLCAQVSPGQNYCLVQTRWTRLYGRQALQRADSAASDQVWRYSPEVHTGGGLGAACHTSADCSSLADERGRRLCCAMVRRGFQKPKRMCDRITPVSLCIAPPPFHQQTGA